ncbi:UNVERIFIED_ORG: amino acid ABC transporter substrate-binding protein (PAAT family) [Burkholderia sp. CF145]|uniref:amino acid ABC transporter substrate-binding protein n=1 Tax=Paraburkholderia hospita TaxID=169430 RepID=UPI0002715840|nr:amino acid ABC transporter substrate-binding protein [Paraburkholderia hospita]EUC12504.1 ABC-type transporter, periplasmic subunit family 3 [Burkholderia sp. BT03]SKC47662.1 amino acid ABC transporter substrate-binding protein, PAAT family [Paraburkholderia hospita]
MKKHILAFSVALLAAGAAHAQSDDTLAKIKASGSITEGVREASGVLSYALGNGVYTGFHYEVCANIIHDVQKQLGLSNLETRYVPVTSANRIPLVKNGTVDIECGSTSNTLTRQTEVAFADTLYVEDVRMAVKANSGINSLSDLNGKTVVTTTGTTALQVARQYKRAKNVDFHEIFGKDHSDSFLLLETGRADAFVLDSQVLAGRIAMARNPKDFKIVGETLSVEPIAIMIRKNDPAFKKAVDGSIARQVRDGTVARLYDKWFMKPIAPSNTTLNLPASAATRAAWENLNDKPAEAYKVN